MFKKYFKLKNDLLLVSISKKIKPIYNIFSQIFGKIVILDKSLDHHLNLLNFILKTTNIEPELLSLGRPK